MVALEPQNAEFQHVYLPAAFQFNNGKPQYVGARVDSRIRRVDSLIRSVYKPESTCIFDKKLPRMWV